MLNDKAPYYNIEALAKRTGLTRRAIRYYVQRGLIPKPEGAGRGHYYTDEHLRLIGKIQAWQKQGVPLAKIKSLLGQEEEPAQACYSGEEAPSPEPAVTAERRMRLHFGNGVELSFREGALSERDIQEIEAYILSKIQNP